MTPDLSYYWEGAREWCGDDKWDEEKKMLQRKVYDYFYQLIICQSLGNTHGTISSRHGRDTPDIMY